MAESFNYTSFPIPAKPLSGVSETNYASALLAIAPGGVKKIPTASFLAAAGVYPIGFLQATPTEVVIVGDSASHYTNVPVTGSDGTGAHDAGMSVPTTGDNAGRIVISEAGLYKISGALRIHRVAGTGEVGCVIMSGSLTTLTSVYSSATDGYLTLECPIVIANLESGAVISMNAAVIGTSSDSITTASLGETPSGKPDSKSVLLVERLTTSSGAEPSEPSLAELAAEVQDAREGYDGTTYASLGAAIRSQIGQAMASGISDDVKTALLQIAAKVAYIDDDGQDYYDALYNALYNNSWAVTNSLTNCISSNPAQSVAKNGSYSATISADVGYVMTGATVSITVGGVDITSTAYNNGNISIASVTGNLIITVTAVAKTLSSISAVYTQSGMVYEDSTLDSLKSDLVVTATYTDSSSETVPSADYTLSGTLTLGTSTITVTYSGMTTTFSVTVSEHWSYSISDLTKVTGTIGNNTRATCGIALSRNTSSDTNGRRSFVMTSGKTDMALDTGSVNQHSGYYPVPVPIGATKFTVSITPSTQFVQVLLRQLNDGVYSAYSADGPTGYVQSSIARTFAAHSDNLYLFITSKYNSAGTTYPTEPTGIDVVYE